MDEVTKDLVAQWIEKAEHDVLAADILVRAERVPWDVVCFHAQQIAEKYLKACLTAHRAYVPKTHDLLELLSLILPLDPSFGHLKEELLVLTDFSVESRYPDAWQGPDEETGRDAYDRARKVREAVRKTPQIQEAIRFLSDRNSDDQETHR